MPETLSTRPIFVTGTAGFIGFHLAKRLLEDGHRVVGIDNLNSYYDVALKEDRLKILDGYDGHRTVRADLADRAAVDAIFAEDNPEYVINLAAQAGVRHSLKAPRDYIEANIAGFLNILEGCRNGDVKHLLYASSSSVYGGNEKMPFSVSDNVDHPKSLYAASKKANELMAHSYSSLYDIPTSGLRFFTVYGPWGRPDMAMYLFMKAMKDGEPLNVFNNGDMYRDFTFVDDIVESIVRLIPQPAAPDPDFDAKNPDPAGSWAPYKVYNIGNSRKERLMDVIDLLQKHAGIEAKLNMMPMQPGDVSATWADTAALEKVTGFTPNTSIDEGIAAFVRWYEEYYG
ncbi:NAD-dependent epimerase [Paracoccaceae bacterium GXU_MW_L88]